MHPSESYPASRVDLTLTSNRDYHPGRPFAVRALWLLVEAIVLLNPVFTPRRPKIWLLRLFGAEIGTGTNIKPSVHGKHPGRLKLGNNVWLGERSWIDNLVEVTIGSNVCISQ